MLETQLISKTPVTLRRLIQYTHIRQKAGFTVHSTDTDQEVQNYFQILWPAVCQSCPDIFNLRPSHFITILENKVNISPENSSRIFVSRLPQKSSIFLYIWNSIFIQHKYIFQMECIDLQYDIQLKNLIMSQPDFKREQYPSLISHLNTPLVLLVSFIFLLF